MKKISIIALILATLLIFSSCGAAKEDKKKNETTKPDVTDTAPGVETDEVTEPSTDEDDSDVTPEPVSKIDFATVTVSGVVYGNVGEETVYPVEGAVSYCSSKPSVATVDSNGNVTCLSEGVTLVGYEKDGEQLAVAICVFAEGDGPDRTSGESVQLFEVGTTFMHTAPVGGVEYISSNESVVDVSGAPMLSFKGSGYACITCASASRPFSYSFVVYDRAVETEAGDEANESTSNEEVYEVIDHSEPSAELLDRIAKDYSDYLWNKSLYSPVTNGPIYVMKYYGLYSGAAAVMVDCPTFYYADVIVEEVIADTLFVYPDSNSIEVWKDSVFYSLQEAYDNGILTKEQIADIAATKPFEYPCPEFTYPELDVHTPAAPARALITQVEGDYLSFLKDNFEGDPETIGPASVCRYYGTYNGAVTVMLNCTGIIPDKTFRKEDVAGWTFRYQDSRDIWVWKDGAIYSLEEAYDNGILTEEDMNVIAKINEYNIPFSIWPGIYLP